jgi:hypothetical protein
MRDQTRWLVCGICLALAGVAQAQDFELDLSAPTPAKKAPVKKGPAKRAEPRKLEPKKVEPAPAAPAEAKAVEPAPAAPAPLPAAPPATAAKSAPASPGLELDLSATANLRAVAVTPPIIRITLSSGSFAGIDTKKTVERFDDKAHKRFVTAFSQKLDGKVIPADVTLAAMQKESLTPFTLRTPAGVQKLARALSVNFVVVMEFNRTGFLVATLYDSSGKPAGGQTAVAQAEKLTQQHADEMAVLVLHELDLLSHQEAPAVLAPVAPQPPQLVEAPPPPVEDEAVDQVHTVPEKTYAPDRDRVRAVVTVGPGGALRQFSVSGDAAAALAELQNNGVVGLGVHARVMPFEWFDRTAGSHFGDLEVEAHYRRAFVHANGVGGSVTGTGCSMTDDDVQVRGTWRYRFGGMAPSIGVGGGWSQERTLFSCSLPLLSTAWRGLDAQLRVRQPLYRDVVALELSAGPRFLQLGDGAQSKGLSLAGEAWLEVLPASWFFARGGARASRLSATQGQALAVVDTRLFFAVEIGAFF